MGRGRSSVVAVCLGAVLVAGCGTESGSKDGPGPGSGAGASEASGSASPSTAEEYEAAAREEHDSAWPAIAEKCRDVPPEPTAAASGSPADGSGPQPENPKWAENHAYKQTTDMSPAEQCRGEAHAALIGAALKDAAPADLGDERRTLRVIEGLGYARDTVGARQAGPDAVAWNVFVAGAGPCISGSTGPDGGIEVHGAYLEGGCVEPVGGH